MNIAFCFSGQIRQFDITYESFKNKILNPLKEHNHYFFAHYPIDENEWKLEKLKFTTIQGELEPDIDEKDYSKNHYVVDRKWNGGRPIQTYLRQLRSVYLANELKKDYELKNNMTFDWVFRLRFDNLYISEIEDLSNLNNKNMYVPNHDNWSGYNDRFAFSSSKNMDIYADRYNNIDEYFNDGERRLHPETFLKWYLDKNNFLVERTKVAHHLLRYNEIWYADFNN